MWDCTTCFDDDVADEIERRGGLSAIALSHPHYYSGHGRLGGALRLPGAACTPTTSAGSRGPDAAHRAVGAARRASSATGLTLIHCGGHFAGGTVLHWRDGAGGAGALLSGDIVQVIPDRTHVGFMYSYPNLIPLPEAAVARIAAGARALRLRGHLRRVVGPARAPRREGDRAALGASATRAPLRGEMAP